jgi:hypothetical protein
MAAIYSNGGNRWNILGFNFTKRDALSSVYKISMCFMVRAVRQLARTYQHLWIGTWQLHGLGCTIWFISVTLSWKGAFIREKSWYC